MHFPIAPTTWRIENSFFGPPAPVSSPLIAITRDVLAAWIPTII